MAKGKVDTTKMHQIVIAAAEKYGVPVDLALAMISAESGFNPNAKSQVGAVGLGQLMPSTARGLGVKNPYDPVQNADGSMRYLKAKLDEFGGNVDLALAAYNAGSGAVRRYGNRVPPYNETRNYIKRIQSNRGKYAKIASNSSKVPADIKQATLQGKVTMNEQNNDNNSKNANAASDMIISSLANEYEAPAYAALNNRDLLTSGGSKQTQLMDMATKIRPDAKAQLQLYLNGLMSFEELNAKYPKMVQELGLTQETERKSPYSPYTTKLLDDMYNKIMPTDEQIRQAQQNVAQQNKQTIDAYNQQRDALAKIMSDAYANQINTISKNPYGDVPNGVYVDPEQYARATANDNFYDTFYGLQGKVSPVQSRQRLVNQALAARNADLVNRYGVPLEEAKQIASTQYNNQVAAAKQNVENAKIQYYYGNISAQQLMKVLQENNSIVNNARANATKQYGDFMSKVMPEMIQQDAETVRRVLQNQGAVDTQAMQNAGSIVNNNVNANNDRDIARYEGEVSQRNQDINAYTQLYNTNVGAVTDAAKLKQNQYQFDTMAPYKQFGTMAPMGYIPNVDLGGTAQNMGIPVQLRQNFQPDRVTNNSPLQTGFQNATANFLGRFVPNTNQEDNQ